MLNKCWVARLEEIILHPQFIWMMKSLTVNRVPPLTSTSPLYVAIFSVPAIPDFSSSLCIIIRGRVLVSCNTDVERCNKVMLCYMLVKANFQSQVKILQIQKLCCQKGFTKFICILSVLMHKCNLKLKLPQNWKLLFRVRRLFIWQAKLAAFKLLNFLMKY